MQEHEIIDRIKFLCEARSWTCYRLAKESGLTYSTLFTMFRKGNAPSISTLIKICSGLGITLSQFFDTGDSRVQLSQAQEQHLQQWDRLTEENRKVLDKYMNYLLSEQP